MVCADPDVVEMNLVNFTFTSYYTKGSTDSLEVGHCFPT